MAWSRSSWAGWPFADTGAIPGALESPCQYRNLRQAAEDAEAKARRGRRPCSQAAKKGDTMTRPKTQISAPGKPRKKDSATRSDLLTLDKAGPIQMGFWV